MLRLGGSANLLKGSAEYGLGTSQETVNNSEARVELYLGTYSLLRFQHLALPPNAGRMSFQSRIPSPSKVNEASRGPRPPAAVKKLPQPQIQARLKLDDPNISKPGLSAIGANQSLIEAPSTTRTPAGGPNRHVTTHARGFSTSTTAKTTVSPHVSGQASVSRIPGKPLDRAKTSSTAVQHKRALSKLTSSRATGPNQSANLPKTRPIGRINTAPTISALGRPNFDTYKQHFSPQKVKQPASQVTPTFSANLNAPPVAGTEVSRLGDELLQLALLQESSDAILQQYTGSINESLRKQHADLKMQHLQLESRERDRQRRDNLNGVRKWFEENSGSNDASFDTLSLLAECVQELGELSREHGPFSRAMKQFDDWQLGVNIALASRVTSEETGVQFVAPISPEWTDLIKSLDNRIKICMNTLSSFGKGNESSAIDGMIKMLSVFAQYLIQEIAVCSGLEVLVLQRQQRWVDSSIEKALLVVKSKGSPDYQVTVRKGIWEDCQG